MRTWLFRALVGLAAALFVVSVALPWWTCEAYHSQYGFQGRVIIYQFGILSAPIEVAGDITPRVQVFLALAFVAVSIALMVWSAFLHGRRATLILAGVGLAYTGYALAAAYLVITPRIEELGGLLQGYSEIMIQPVGELVTITTALQPGYYLACAAGALTFLLALGRGVITGRSATERT